MELEENMYVRTKYNGIGKIVEYINDATHYFFKCYKLDRDCSNCEEYITKADVIGEPSYNIIDLIEVGDYVNGYYVTSGSKSDGCSLGSIYIAEIDGLGLHKKIYEKDIKSVVTKEQFSQMEYKVGE